MEHVDPLERQNALTLVQKQFKETTEKLSRAEKMKSRKPTNVFWSPQSEAAFQEQLGEIRKRPGIDSNLLAQKENELSKPLLREAEVRAQEIIAAQNPDPKAQTDAKSVLALLSEMTQIDKD